MKTKLFLFALCFLPMAANAAIPYRVEQVKMPDPITPTGYDAEALARLKRFYIGGSYNFSLWQDYTNDKDMHASGKNSSGFDVVAGLRLYDIFRLEANYIHTDVKYDVFSLTGDMAMLNAIFDARIDNLYRIFRSQMLVPYVGLGAGLSWNRAADDVKLDKKITPVLAALAGLSVEFNDIFALDFGYKYFYMFDPQADVMPDINPTAHQFRVGARLHF